MHVDYFIILTYVCEYPFLTFSCSTNEALTPKFNLPDKVIIAIIKRIIIAIRGKYI